MRALAILALAGCNLYNVANDDDAVCPAQSAAPVLVRDPFTGECVERGPAVCDGCKPCPLDLTKDYAVCGGPCEALAESACLATPACRVAYEVDPRTSRSGFLGCWPTETDKPLPTKACEQLDVLACPYRNDCAAWYASTAGGRRFDHCAAEVTPPACASLTGEVPCAARSDCEPIYRGDNCTCTPTSCTCETRTYERCAGKP